MIQYLCYYLLASALFVILSLAYNYFKGKTTHFEKFIYILIYSAIWPFSILALIGLAAIQTGIFIFDFFTLKSQK